MLKQPEISNFCIDQRLKLKCNAYFEDIEILIKVE